MLEMSLKNLQSEKNKKDAKLYANMFQLTREDADVALKVGFRSDLQLDHLHLIIVLSVRDSLIFLDKKEPSSDDHKIEWKSRI